MSAPIEEYIIAPGSLGEDRFMVIFRVPPEAHPGPARYRAIRAYYCNPLHQLFDWPILVIAPDQQVTILPAGGGDGDGIPSVGRGPPP